VKDNNRDFDLLADIAGLLKKYGPEAFEHLAERLSSPELLERLVSILRTSAKAAGTANIGKQPRKKKQSSADFRASLMLLEDKEKAELLVRFYDGLMAKTILPTLRDLQSFVSDAGLSPLKAKIREKAVIQVVKNLRSISLEELQSAISTVRQESFQDDRSLEGWSNIILNKKRSTTLRE
jgi:hypothetical protein